MTLVQKFIHSSLSVMLLLGTATLFNGQAHAQFSTQAQPQFSAPIRDVDNPARQPVQFNAFVTFPDGAQFADVESPFVVPNGKRLVIELITGEIFVRTGQLLRVHLVTTANGNFAPNHALNFRDKTAFSGSQDIYTLTQPVRLYGDAGSQIQLVVQRGGTTGSSGTAEVTFSGYLVNMP